MYMEDLLLVLQSVSLCVVIAGTVSQSNLRLSGSLPHGDNVHCDPAYRNLTTFSVTRVVQLPFTGALP